MPGNIRYYETDRQHQIHFRVKIGHISLENGGTCIIIAATPLEPIRKVLRCLEESLVFGITIFLVILFVSGHYFSKYVLHPMSVTTTRINRITEEHLSERFEIVNKNDELGQIQYAINGLFDRLENSFVTQRQFISNVSHELRTPLSILMLSLEALEPTNRSADRKKLATALEMTYHMNGLVRVLLLLSQLDEKRRTIQKNTVNLFELIDDIRNRYAPLITRKKLNFSFHGGRNIIVEGDKELLEIMFSNLLDNAIKYTLKGSVSVMVRKLMGWTEIRITDTGIGIPAVNLDRAFDRFYRGEESRRMNKGYGIGLSLAKKIVELHGGNIGLKSREGKGTVVTVFLTE